MSAWVAWLIILGSILLLGLIIKLVRYYCSFRRNSPGLPVKLGVRHAFCCLLLDMELRVLKKQQDGSYSRAWFWESR